MSKGCVRHSTKTSKNSKLLEAMIETQKEKEAKKKKKAEEEMKMLSKSDATRLKSIAARGGKKYAEDWVPSNFILIYGTKPGAMVNLDTKMVKDFITNILRRLDKKTLHVTFPDCLDQMKTEDADFESAVSNTIQKLNLFHRESIYKANFT